MPDSSLLQTFPNPHPGRDYLIEHRVHDFTSLCPLTGQPDFASLTIRYVAREVCLELKHLKLYLQTFRNEGVYYEDATNVILNDLVTSCKPKWMLVRSKWKVRGGIRSIIIAQHGEPPVGAPPSGR